MSTTTEGRTEISTMQLLRQRYRCNYITVEELLKNHLPSYSSAKTLKQAIRAGRIPLTITRLGNTRKGDEVVALADLAALLDQAKKPAADQAA